MNEMETADVCFNRCGLRGPSAEGDKFRSDGDALGDFHADYRFERFSSPEFDTESRNSNCSRESCWQTYSTAACVPMVVAPAESGPNVQDSSLA